MTKSLKCRVCGCTNARACPGGCYWVQSDLCSACAVSPGRFEEQALPGFGNADLADERDLEDRR
jgi:hypothetical protein